MSVCLSRSCISSTSSNFDTTCVCAIQSGFTKDASYDGDVHMRYVNFLVPQDKLWNAMLDALCAFVKQKNKVNVDLYIASSQTCL